MNCKKLVVVGDKFNEFAISNDVFYTKNLKIPQIYDNKIFLHIPIIFLQMGLYFYQERYFELLSL